jgi:hypothetical protein
MLQVANILREGLTWNHKTYHDKSAYYSRTETRPVIRKGTQPRAGYRVVLDADYEEAGVYSVEKGKIDIMRGHSHL